MRRGAIEVIVTNHPRLMGKRIVIVDSADVAPVAVEIALARGRRAAAELIEVGGDGQRKLRGDDLGAGGGKRAFQQGCLNGLFVTIREGGSRSVERSGRFADECLDGESAGTDFTSIFCTKGS